MAKDSAQEQAHTGEVLIRWSEHRSRRYVTVLCPVGHLVTSREITPDSWPGSALEADIAAHQHGSRPWIVTCHGTVPDGT